MRIGPSVVARFRQIAPPSKERRAPAAVDLGKLQPGLQRATQFFADHLGAVRAPLKYEVGEGSDALRTGYNFETGKLCFPHLEGVRNAGLDSDDVIHHEAFHGLLVQNYPHTAQDMRNPEVVALHEGLADYFAYLLSPDEGFGEDYLLHGRALRSYAHDLALNLASGPHAQGNVITRHLIENQVSPRQLRKFLQSADFSLESLARVCPSLQQSLERERSLDLKETIGGYEPSRLQRYRIHPERPLQLGFQLNQEMDLRIEWKGARGFPIRHFQVTAGPQNTFAVSPRQDARAEKVVAEFYREDRLIGFRPYYFSPEFG